ncbi:unnamed protein product [Victoria cruziana]
MEVGNGGTRTVALEMEGIVTAYRDGTLYRAPLPTVEPCEDPLDGVACRDVLINEATGVKVRIYAAWTDSEPPAKSPVLFYFHAGGFCLGSTSVVEIHGFLHRLCKTAGAMVVSVDYRRSPEHRLPAAYEDCLDAVSWAAEGGDRWISNYADLTECFVCGDSSGGNIVHQIIVRLADPAAESAAPKLVVRGYVLIQPFFGSQTKTEYELSCIEQGEPYVTFSSWYDLFWELSLPEGTDRDNPFCNPWVGSIGHVKPRAAAVLVTVAGLDLLREKGLSYAELARTRLKIEEVEVMVEEGQHHGYHMRQPDSPQSDRLINRIALFMGARSAKHEQDPRT